MPKERKKRKITNEEDSPALNGGNFSMSIGDIFGKTKAAPLKKVAAGNEEKRKIPVIAEKAEEAIKRLSKITLHRQSAGMGGKVATVVTFSGEAADLEALAKELRKGLGCGSRVIEGKIILQGDIRERARDWFVKKGAHRVVLGN